MGLFLELLTVTFGILDEVSKFFVSIKLQVDFSLHYLDVFVCFLEADQSAVVFLVDYDYGC